MWLQCLAGIPWHWWCRHCMSSFQDIYPLHLERGTRKPPVKRPEGSRMWNIFNEGPSGPILSTCLKSGVPDAEPNYIAQLGAMEPRHPVLTVPGSRSPPPGSQPETCCVNLDTTPPLSGPRLFVSPEVPQHSSWIPQDRSRDMEPLS